MDNEVLQVIKSTIKETVNGKIDHLTEMIKEHNTKHEKDMQTILPVIEAFNGVSVAGNGIKWIAGVGTAIGVVWLLFKGILKQ